MGVWLQYYAFDVIGEINFFKKLGFLEEGRDIDGMIQTIQRILIYAALCGQIPEVHYLLLGNPLISFFMPSMDKWDQVLQFTLKTMNSRSMSNLNGEKAEDKQNDGKDMLSRWMKIHKSNSEKLSTLDIIVHLSANVFAGSDTTAIALRATLYLLLHHPVVMDKVQAEISSAASDQKLSDIISYRESVTHLPYLGAVLKEAMRLHPSVGLILEREVPEGGALISGKQIPAGTIVGINAWVLHQNSQIFQDPEAFLPERWLDSPPDALREMERTFFSFGAGSRTCLGKNISLLEMHKIVPQLLRDFEIRLHSPEKSWTTKNTWFVQQQDFICDIRERNNMA
ncbi:Cytochrome P450 E-class group I [Penicillium taxi]|uniref:Cytochrome P450 E-class group I n=1 Tax=Penicillium taxi TaxID=168475 RepID=UPI0025452FFB|nr:Cytochrome P450 E-class group I [Penicillium taxi]KAJ5908872.1 Cytochrome P450 E-class group I [Penicillium taxi]